MVRFKLVIALFLSIFAAHPCLGSPSRYIVAQPDATAAVSIGTLLYAAAPTWDTYWTLDNATNEDVFVPTSDKIIGPVPSYKLKANATHIVDGVCSDSRDCVGQYGSIDVSLPDGVEATSSFHFHSSGTVAAFDVPFLRYANALQKLGDVGVLRGLRNDGKTVTTLIVVNKGPSIAYLTLTIVDGDNHYLGTQFVTTPIGLITTSVNTNFDAGRVYVQLGQQVGFPNNFGTHYVAAVVGPPIGTSQRVVLLQRGQAPVIVNDQATVLLLPRTDN